jgi:hypothetical protein
MGRSRSLDHVVLKPEAFQGMSRGSLFYPCSGRDWDLPIDTFLPWVDDFWFVDVNYRVERPIGPQRSLVRVNMEQLEGVTLTARTPYRVTVRHEEHRSRDGRYYRTHFCKGRGYDVFRSVFRVPNKKISIFFHRGDSPGEGGSNFYWLGEDRLPNVIDQLEIGGLVVSDGSLAMEQFRRDFDPEIFELDYVEGFDLAGRTFSCVGYLGQRNGPTLVWKANAHD